MPEAAVVTFDIVGFCNVLVKLLGPVQEYVAPPDEVRLSVVFSQTGALLPMAVLGEGCTVTDVVAESEHPAVVTLTV